MQFALHQYLQFFHKQLQYECGVEKHCVVELNAKLRVKVRFERFY